MLSGLWSGTAFAGSSSSTDVLPLQAPSVADSGDGTVEPTGRRVEPKSPLENHADNLIDAASPVSISGVPSSPPRPRLQRASTDSVRVSMSKPKESVHDRVLGSLLAPLTGGAGSKPPANAPTSASAAFPNGPEDVFNPASGAHAGVLRATAADTSTSATTTGPHPNGATETPKEKEIDPVQAHADMWAQLSKIRVLQSDIAKMHLALDRPGIVESSSAASAGDARKASRHSARTETLMTNAATLATSATRSGTMGTHQSLGGAIGSPLSPATMGTGFGTIPHQPKSQSTDDAVVDEFARRKEAIGSIMAKLDALSVAVTEFHTLPTPPLNFPSPSTATSSRANSLQPFAPLKTPNSIPMNSPWARPPSSMSDHSLTGSATAINSGFGGFGSTPRPVSPPLRRTNTAPMSSNAPTAGRSDTRRSSAGSPVPSSSTPYPMTSALTSPRSPSPTSPSPLLTPTTNSPSTPFAPPHPARRSMAITPSPLAHSINISPPSSPPSTIRRTAPTSPGMRSDDGDEYEESTPLMRLAPPPAAVISPKGKGPMQSLPVLERQRLSTLYEPPGSEYRSSRGSDILRELEIAEASSIRKSVASSKKKTAKRRGRRLGGGGSDDEEDEDEDEYELAPLAPPPPISTLAVPRSRPRSHPHAQQHAGYGNRTASNTSSSTQSSGIERVMHVDGVPVPLAPGSFKVTSHHESPPGTPNSLQTSAALPTP